MKTPRSNYDLWGWQQLDYSVESFHSRNSEVTHCVIPKKLFLVNELELLKCLGKQFIGKIPLSSFSVLWTMAVCALHLQLRYLIEI